MKKKKKKNNMKLLFNYDYLFIFETQLTRLEDPSFWKSLDLLNILGVNFREREDLLWSPLPFSQAPVCVARLVLFLNSSGKDYLAYCF